MPSVGQVAPGVAFAIARAEYLAFHVDEDRSRWIAWPVAWTTGSCFIYGPPRPSMTKPVFHNNCIKHAQYRRVERSVGIHLLRTQWNKCVHIGLIPANQEFTEQSGTFQDLPLTPESFEFLGPLEDRDLETDALGSTPAIAEDFVFAASLPGGETHQDMSHDESSLRDTPPGEAANGSRGENVLNH